MAEIGFYALPYIALALITHQRMSASACEGEFVDDYGSSSSSSSSSGYFSSHAYPQSDLTIEPIFIS